MRLILNKINLGGDEMAKTDICKDMNLLHPTFRKIVEEALRRCVKAGIKAKVSETFRYGDRQNMLYKQGKSKLKAGFSMHEFGLAVDVFNNVKGHEYDPAIMLKIHKIFQDVNPHVIWGNDWDNDGDSKDETFHDSPHHQYTWPYTQKQIYAGKRPK